jgi:hypothetical protein
MCREAGFLDILAHFKAVSASQSKDGKAHPALCYDHFHGRVPKHIERANGVSLADRLLAMNAAPEPPQVEQTELCACGKVNHHRGACRGRPRGGWSGKPQTAIVLAPKPKPGDGHFCACGCGTEMFGLHNYKRGHHPNSTSTKLAKVTVERSLTQSTKVTVERGQEITLDRRVTILVPHAKPSMQVKLTPELAEAVWASLSLEQKAQVFDMEGLWREYDDDLRMMLVSKVLLLYPGDVKPAEGEVK